MDNASGSTTPDEDETHAVLNYENEATFDRFVVVRLADIKARLMATGSISNRDGKDLAALTRIQSLEPPPPRAGRWIPAMLFIVTFALIAGLFFTHIPTASVDFEGEVSELTFTADRAHNLPLPSSVKSLSLGGAEAIDFWRWALFPRLARRTPSNT